MEGSRKGGNPISHLALWFAKAECSLAGSAPLDVRLTARRHHGAPPTGEPTLRQVITPLAAAALIAGVPVAARAQGARSSPTVRSPRLAAELSLLGTVVPTALGVAMGEGGGSLRGWLIAYGVLVGPSTGYFYAGQVGRGIGTTALRFGILLGAAAGVMGACGGFWGCDDPGAANAIAIVGLGAYAASALYDIARAGAAAEAWNARHAERRVTVIPQIDPVTRSGGVSVRIGL